MASNLTNKELLNKVSKHIDYLRAEFSELTYEFNNLQKRLNCIEKHRQKICIKCGAARKHHHDLI